MPSVVLLRAPLRARGQEFFLTGRKRALVEAIAKESYPLADPPRRRRSTLPTNKLSTSIYSS